MSLAAMKKPILEVHDGITVVREDLFCPAVPSGKLRALLPYFTTLVSRGIVGVVNHAVSYSNSHAIVAYAGAATGLKVVSYANCKYSTPQTQLAESLGAKIVYVGGMQLGPLSARAKKHQEAGHLILPWALGIHEAFVHVGSMLADAGADQYHGWKYDCHVVPVGGGGYACGVEWGVRENKLGGRVIGVPYTGTVARNRKRIDAVRPGARVELVARPTPVETPFPSDPHYEWGAWPVALALRDEGKSVCFWSVGVPLCRSPSALSG